MSDAYFLLALWRSAKSVSELKASAERADGQLSIRASPVTVLEGQPDQAAALTQWPNADAARQHAVMLNQMPTPPQETWLFPALPAAGVAGAPFPSRADVNEPSGDYPAYLVVVGNVSDRDKLTAYSARIWPMYRQRGGYYLALATADTVTAEAPSDTPPPSIIVARWPSTAAANDFWFSREYQEGAIPLRAEAGTFNVLLMTTETGSVD